MSILGKRVSQKIKDKKWTIDRTAEESDIPVSTLKKIIYRKSDDKVQLTTLKKLANIFKCKIDDLLSENNDEKPKEEKVKRSQESNAKLFKECVDYVSNYCDKNKLSLDKDQIILAVDSLYKLMLCQSESNNKAKLDDDICRFVFQQLCFAA